MGIDTINAIPEWTAFPVLIVLLVLMRLPQARTVTLWVYNLALAVGFIAPLLAAGDWRVSLFVAYFCAAVLAFGAVAIVGVLLMRMLRLRHTTST